MILTLPWPPSVNHYWRETERRGFKVLTKRAREYRANVLACCAEQKAHRRLAGRRLKVRIDAFPPDRRARDLDNLPKGILDSLQHAKVIEDDGHIDHLTITRQEVVKGGQVIVTVEVAA